MKINSLKNEKKNFEINKNSQAHRKCAKFNPWHILLLALFWPPRMRATADALLLFISLTYFHFVLRRDLFAIALSSQKNQNQETKKNRK